MAMKIFKKGDVITTQTINAMIYGQPGVGKSSIVFTSDDVLLMDFDGGAHRSRFSDLGEVIRFETWKDVIELMDTTIDRNGKEVPYLSQFKTIAIDTVGKCLDVLMLHIIKHNPKAGTGSGAPSISGWGELQSSFNMWLGELKKLGISCIFIAHEKDKDKGEQSFIRPDISGRSYQIILQQCDFVGRMYHGAKSVELNFSPTEFTVGKNSAHFPVLIMPDFKKQPRYFADKMQEMINGLNRIGEQDKLIRDSVEECKAAYATYTDLGQFNETIGKLKQFTFLSKSHESQVKSALISSADKFGAVMNPKTKLFELKEPLPVEDAENPSDYAPE